MALTCPLCGKDVPVPDSWQGVPVERLRVQHGPVHTIWYEAG